jgi:DNA ligase-1
VKGGRLLSRSLKPIPNIYIQTLLSKAGYEGLDGELIVGSPTAKDCYTKTVSHVMAIEKHSFNFKFFVFDKHDEPGMYLDRHARLEKIVVKNSLSIELLKQSRIDDVEQLQAYEQKIITEGYEGVILRSFEGPYKHGRSTLKEGILLKLKRFTDSEAMIIGFVELQHNENEATTNELGATARSHKKGGMVAAGTLGALKVRDLKTGVEFEVGTGFDQRTRDELWATRNKLGGLVVKYKHFEVGAKDKPRHPVFLGFRSSIDM